MIETLKPGSVNLNDYSIDQKTIDHFVRFNTILIENSDNPRNAQAQLIKANLGNTYWYYLRYLNPQRSKRELKVRSFDERVY